MSSVIVYLERDVGPNTNPAAPKIYNRPAARLSAPEHLMTSCRVCGAPNDLEQRRRAVASPGKPPSTSVQPVTNKTGPITDTPRFNAFPVRTSTQHRTTCKLKASERKTNRDQLLPGVLGSAPAQIFRTEEPAIGAENFIAEHSWNQ